MGGLLASAWRGWKRFGRKVGDFQAHALLTLFYFVVVPPFALVIRLSADPLRSGSGAPTAWRPRAPATGTALERGRRQF